MTIAGDDPVLIAGAGIGGLAAAIALARVGCRVHVLEQRAEFDEEGAGIQIGPNGVHALRQLGVAGLLEARLVEQTPELPHGATEIAIMEGRTGRCLARLPLNPRMQNAFGAPYWVARRADLHAALLERVRGLPGVVVNHGFGVETVEHLARERVGVGSVTGQRRQGAALVGADGLWSKVARHALGAAMPRFAQRTAARALLPLDGLPAPFDRPVTGLWLGRRAHLVHYRVRPDATPANHHASPMLNVVAIVEGGREASDWGQVVDVAELLPAFAGWSPAVHDLLGRAGTWRRWSLFERPDLDRWCDGPVTVLGDAAHPVLPFLAQGAVLALEDAVALAVAVQASPSDLPAAFRAYALARRPRALAVTRASRRNGRIYHLSGPAAAARNAALSWLPPERLMATYDWLYGHRGPDLGDPGPGAIPQAPSTMS